MADDLYFSVPDVEGACARAEALYNRVYAALQAVLPGTAIVQHIGATSIPGCLTKGDLDIVVRVQAGDFDQVDAILEGMFARNTGSVRTLPLSKIQTLIRRWACNSRRSAGNTTTFTTSPMLCAAIRHCWSSTTPSSAPMKAS
jgi:GrpB-like predicted nucleotidyltransferase (UPF0157 family)